MIHRKFISFCCQSKGSKILKLMAAKSRPSSDYAGFHKELAKSKHVIVLTGAGISADSGIPTFRGAGGLWRTYESMNLATPQAFSRDPSLVWEFYHYRREVVFKAKPNAGHYALANLEEKLRKQGREMVVITQNIDGLHAASGSKNILELHGNLFKTRCTKCRDEVDNRDSPICPALKDKGSPDPNATTSTIPLEQLPRCGKCGGLVRPAVVWFGESLDRNVLSSAQDHLEKCDLCLIVGTSALVQPSASFGMMVAERGVTVAEFNIEATPNTGFVKYHFEGPGSTTLPKALELP